MTTTQRIQAATHQLRQHLATASISRHHKRRLAIVPLAFALVFASLLTFNPTTVPSAGAASCSATSGTPYKGWSYRDSRWIVAAQITITCTSTSLIRDTMLLRQEDTWTSNSSAVQNEIIGTQLRTTTYVPCRSGTHSYRTTGFPSARINSWSGDYYSQDIRSPLVYITC